MLSFKGMNKNKVKRKIFDESRDVKLTYTCSFIGLGEKRERSSQFWHMTHQMHQYQSLGEINQSIIKVCPFPYLHLPGLWLQTKHYLIMINIKGLVCSNYVCLFFEPPTYCLEVNKCGAQSFEEITFRLKKPNGNIHFQRRCPVFSFLVKKWSLFISLNSSINILWII